VATTWTIQQCRQQHKEINRLATAGYKDKEIADMLHIAPATVRNTLASPVTAEHRRELEAMRDAATVDIAKDIKLMAPAALEILNNMIHSEDTQNAVKAKVCLSILDRAGYGPVQKMETLNANVHITAHDLNEIKARARTMGILQKEEKSDERTIAGTVHKEDDDREPGIDSSGPTDVVRGETSG